MMVAARSEVMRRRVVGMASDFRLDGSEYIKLTRGFVNCILWFEVKSSQSSRWASVYSVVYVLFTRSDRTTWIQWRNASTPLRSSCTV